MINEWGKEFRKFIRRKRLEQNITMEALCQGLCDAGTICKIESGEYMPEKLMRDRILARLGISGASYETYMPGDEYDRWEKRNRILTKIIDEEMDEASELLEQYRKECIGEEGAAASKKNQNILDYQFYLAMKGQIMAYRDVQAKELSRIYRDSVFATMPDVLDGSFDGHSFSVQELNLILEWLRYGLEDAHMDSSRKTGSYKGVLRYIEEHHLDQSSRAKIYPKAVYYYCRASLEEDLDMEKMKELLEFCGKGIEALRDDAKAHYFLELLWTKLYLLNRIYEKKAYKEMDEAAAQLLTAIDEAKQWTEVLTKLYQQNGIRKEMYEYCYLYLEYDVYSIGDVIRTRRKMLGMSQDVLSSGICSRRTLMRLERGETKTSWKYVGGLFRKMGLSTEYQKYELESENPEAKRLMNELTVKQNNGMLEECADLLCQIRELVPMRNMVNRQTIQRYEALCRWQAGKISKTEFKYKVVQALGYTVSRSKLFGPKKVYLSAGELLCIHNMTLAMTWDEDEELEPYLGLLQRECEETERSQMVYARIQLYELWRYHIASCLGNKGDYEASNKISLQSQKHSLRLRRLNLSYMYLYNVVWNREQEDKELYRSDNDRKDSLKACAVLSSMCRDERSQAHFIRKMAI